jgi:hypothetical protein
MISWTAARHAFVIANRLIGNDDDAAGISAP